MEITKLKGWKEQKIFNRKPWLKNFSDKKTELEAKSTTEFAEVLYKSMDIRGKYEKNNSRIRK